MLLTGIRNPGLRPYLLIPVVPSDARISAHASMAAILAPSGDLYTKNKKLFKLKSFCHDQSGNRTRVCAVRGRRLSRLTNRPQNRGDKIRTCDLSVPNAALHQTEPHLENNIGSRGRGARTPIYGFGDRCSTIELFP